MTLKLENGDCLELMKKLPDKSIDLFICDLPYGETNCKWDSKIDLEQFWKEFKRLRKSKRVACIHFCSTKFGYTLIKSWVKGYKMDMCMVKRNKTGALLSKHRPMRNHEMVYFFYEQSPKYLRDKYHKRIVAVPPSSSMGEKKEKNKTIPSKNRKGMGEQSGIYSKENRTNSNFDPPNPASVLEEEEKTVYGIELGNKAKDMDMDGKQRYDPLLPASVLEEDEPTTTFKCKKVFIGKRHHQTEKPLDILEFFLKYWSDEGDTILDPTMGSGSVGVACKKLLRNFVGYELDKKIFKIAEDRINNN